MQTDESNIFVHGKFSAGSLTISDGQIEKVEIKGPQRAGLPFMLPGFVDIHVHGSCGYDFLSPGGGYEEISQCLVRNGVTSFMPTFAAAPSKSILSSILAFSRAKCSGADPFAIHLEGPFISPARKGAQNPVFMRTPDIGELKRYTEASGGKIGLVTLAPELPGSEEFVRYCVQNSIVCSIGHSDATFEQAAASFRWGITVVNHSFNAMSPLHHRKPGVVGAMLLSDNVYCELIADGFHVSPGAVRLLAKNVGPEHIVLITDGIMAQNAGDGEYETEAFRFVVKNGAAMLRDGTLAGSTLTMDSALRNMLSMTSLSLEKVVPMLTSNPCRAAGLNDRGEIEKGRRADLVILDETMNVTGTYVEGRKVFSK